MSAEAELALIAVRALNAGVTYLRARNVSMQRLGELMQQAHDEGRDLTMDEVMMLVESADEADQQLNEAIRRHE